MARKSQNLQIFGIDFQGLQRHSILLFPPIRQLSKRGSPRVITAVWAEHERPESSRNTAVNESLRRMWKCSANKCCNMCVLCAIMNTNPAPRRLSLVLLKVHGCLAKLLQVSMNMSQPNSNYQHGHSYQSFFVVVVFVFFLCLSQIPGMGLIPAKTRIRAEELIIAWLQSSSHPEMSNFTNRFP